MTLLAHNEKFGEKQTLEEHLRKVAEKSRKLVAKKQLDLDEDIERFVEILGLCHDFGKTNILFQEYLEGSKVNDKKKQHSLISAYYVFTVLKEEGFSEKMQIVGWLIILKHHGNLENPFGGKSGQIKEKEYKAKNLLPFQIKKLDPKTPKLYEKLGINYLQEFKKRIDSNDIFDDIRKISRKHSLNRFGKKPENFFLALFCFSVLLDADKMDTAGFSYAKWPSVGSSIDIPEDIVEKYKDVQGWDNPTSEINNMRESAYREAEEALETDSKLMTLTLPTGAGKTLTALNMAMKLREQSDFERSPRIIYSLPFLSIIDQNHQVIERVLENSNLLKKDKPRPDLLLRHDHLSPGYAASEDEDEKPGSPILLTEGWNSEIINTTFVQFFETLFSTENSSARKFHKIANSIILLDEVQSLPIKYWTPVENAFEILAEKFNSRMILMTATQPELIEEENSKEAIAEESKKEYFKKFDRVDYEFDLNMNSIENLAKEIAKEGNSEKDLMAVMNTRNSCEALYRELENLEDDSRKIIFLSTDLLPADREKRISQIKESEKSVLIITTQLIEAGVDIDMDKVWRDFAPLDSIVQTAGRCNREDSDVKGMVKVVSLKDDRRFLHSYVYDSVLTGITEEVIQEFSNEKISESEFNQQAISSYFDKVHSRKSKDDEDILENIRNLNFSDIKVSLIESSKSLPVFVKLNEEAVETYEKVVEIHDKPYFERREKMQEIKSEFHKYILNVPLYTDEDKENIQHLPISEFSDNFREIQGDKVGSDKNVWYDIDTGFQFPSSITKDRIL